jgi:hypothetical protein
MTQERYKVQHESLDESGRVTDFQRIVRVMRKLETHPDTRMGRNARMGSEPPMSWLSQL